MVSHKPVKLSASHWLKVVAIFTSVIWRSICVTTTWTLERSRDSWPLTRRFAVAFLRQAGRLTHEEIRATAVPTGQQIREYCKHKGLPLSSVDLDPQRADIPTATLHFINASPEEESSILLFCHGGGYNNPIIKDGHIPYAIHAAKLAKDFQGRVAMLEYTLTPALKYPGQLVQAVAALKLLLSHRKPEQIILAGDSAGGNLILALLAHLKQKHPDVPQLSLPPASKFRAVLLMSPWVSFQTSAPSFKENVKTDYLTFEGMGDFKEMWQPVESHVWAQPLLGGVEFWDRRHLPVHKLLITAGGWEVIRDEVVAMAETMGAVPASSDPEAQVQFALGPQEVHVQSVFDEVLGLHGSSMARSIDDWLLHV